MRAFLLALFGGLGLIIAYWLFDREPPVIVYDAKVIGTVMPGQDIIISYDVLRKRGCYTYIERVIYDGKRTRDILPDADMEVPDKLGLDTYRTRAPLFAKAEPGEGTMSITLSWRCNPSHRLWPIQTTLTIPLNILKHAR